MSEADRIVFERLAQAGLEDAGPLALELREGVTRQGLRAVAAAAVHVAAAAPERMIAIYDGLAAGWLSREAPRVEPRAFDPLPISANWWRTIWTIANPPAGAGRLRYAQQMMELAGELHPGINGRMATAALAFPGVAEASGRGIPEPHDVEWLSQFSPATLGYALSQELLRAGSPAFDPYWASVMPYLRHMPGPLNYINVQAIQSMPLWALVAGYTARGLDRIAFGGFLMGQLGHHYSALATAVTLMTATVNRPENVEVVLDCVFKGWAHGRQTQLLALAPWDELWSLRVDQARETLKIEAFDSPYARSAHEGWVPRVV